MKAVVTGMIATYGLGGVVWDCGQYLVGLERLGFEVYYLEDTGWEAYDPVLRQYGSDYAHGAAYAASALTSLSPTLAQRWHVRGMNGETYGLSRDMMNDVVADADLLLLNVSGAALLREPYRRCRRKVLVDTDPGWNHFRNYPRWDAGQGWPDAASWRDHDYFFTYAEGIGRPGCSLPLLGVDWSPTRPPVILDMWAAETAPDAAWTTVMTWDNFREPIVHEGRTYGSTELEFHRIVDLPRLVDLRPEVAVGGSNAPAASWRQSGWRVVDAATVTWSPEDYRRYIQRSRGELSVAKNVYVETGSGWFSCRSVCYLAAGLPVAVQDTGFSAWLPCGEGLLAFSNLSQAVAALREVEGDYEAHAAAARRVAEEHFGSDAVLTAILTTVGLG